MNDVLQNWKTDYTGAAIYSLVDENGKRYIGQTMNLKRRLYIHNREFNMIHDDPNAYTTEGKTLSEAIRNGRVFTVEVLEYVPCLAASVNNLRNLELYYYEKYGGSANTYNTAPIIPPLVNHEPFNMVTLTIDITEEDIIEYVEQKDNLNEFIKDLIRKNINKGS